VRLRGTCRNYSRETQQIIDDGIRRAAAGVALMMGVEITVNIAYGVGATINTATEAELAASACVEAGLAVRRDLAPAMTGEDFGWMLEQRPGAYVWIGNGPGGAGRDLHNDGYNYNDAILPAASTFFASVAKKALGAG
jgi:metal-dependent amidase/aminoacylase/carboxypeptidase family protein